MKFIHAADIHLDSALRGLERYEGAPVDEIRGATRRAFDNLIELAIEEKVDFLLLAGDLYDGDWRDYNVGLYFAERMGRLREAGIPVFIVTGNHDAANQITKHLRLPENVTRFATRLPERVVLEDLEVAIHGQGFPKRVVTDDLSQAYPQGDPQLFNIGLLHTCLDGKPGHEPYAPCTAEGLRSKGYDYWALGHIHKREVVCRDPWIVFPGNLQGRYVREAGAKGCTLVTVDNREVVQAEHRDLDVLRWSLCAVDITGSETLDEVHAQVHKTLQQALEAAEDRPVAARLVLRGTGAVHGRLHVDLERWTQEYRALATDLGGAGVWVEKVVLQTQPVLSLERLLAGDGALSGLLRGIRDRELDDSALADLVHEVAALRRKLPPELLSGEERFDPSEPRQLQSTLEDIKELLVNRLLTAGTR